jgi:hypothetical protein
MATTNIGDKDMAGFTIKALVPNTIDDIGRLKNIIMLLL